MSALGTPAEPRPPPMFDRGFGWRVGTSIVSFFGLVSYVLLYFAFWSTSYTAVQGAVLIVVGLLLFVAVNGAAWASWGIRRTGHPTL
jgi:hypothetical protein